MVLIDFGCAVGVALVLRQFGEEVRRPLQLVAALLDCWVFLLNVHPLRLFGLSKLVCNQLLLVVDAPERTILRRHLDDRHCQLEVFQLLVELAVTLLGVNGLQ